MTSKKYCVMVSLLYVRWIFIYSHIIHMVFLALEWLICLKIITQFKKSPVFNIILLLYSANILLVFWRLYFIIWMPSMSSWSIFVYPCNKFSVRDIFNIASLCSFYLPFPPIILTITFDPLFNFSFLQSILLRLRWWKLDVFGRKADNFFFISLFWTFLIYPPFWYSRPIPEATLTRLTFLSLVLIALLLTWYI